MTAARSSDDGRTWLPSAVERLRRPNATCNAIFPAIVGAGPIPSGDFAIPADGKTKDRLAGGLLENLMEWV